MELVTAFGLGILAGVAALWAVATIFYIGDSDGE